MILLSVISVTLLKVFLCVSQTEYPLYAIVSGSPSLSDLSNDDIKTLATNFIGGQLAATKDVVDKIHSYNPSFKMLKYHNTWSTQDISYVENDKSSILKYPFAKLLNNLTNSLNDNIIKLQLFNEYGNTIPLYESTEMNSNCSQSCDNFISWIQIGNEYMKVLKIDTIQNNEFSLTVQRGFIGNIDSKNYISSHKINSNIFGAVYFDVGPKKCSKLQYEVNIQSVYGRDSLVNATHEDLTSYDADGSWYDCFASNAFEASNMISDRIGVTHIWNDNLNTYYNCSTYRISEQQRLTSIFDKLSESPYNVDLSKLVMYANDMSSGGYFNCELGDMLIKDSIKNYNKPLDGYCIEAYALHETGDCTESEIAYLATSNWLNNVNELINASYLNLNARPMIAQAGCKSPAIEKLDYETYNQVMLFGYVSFLFGVTNKNTNTVAFGIPPRRQVNNTVYITVNEVFYFNIGNPIENLNNINNYLINDNNGKTHFSYKRYFDNGLILINPTNETDYGIVLNTTYYNPYNGNKMGNSVDINGYTAYLLLLKV